jgi:hypothetical protein
MIIPKATAKQALCIIDVQPKTLIWERPLELVKKIRKFMDIVPYEAYIVVEYNAPESCMMFKQTWWSITKEDAWPTDQNILDFVKNKKNVCYIEKTDRSCFALENQEKILKFLKENSIEEIHLVWFDTDDCVLATLYWWIGCWLYCYVLEELTNHHAYNEELYNSALTIFRHCHLSNNNIHPKISSIEINF